MPRLPAVELEAPEVIEVAVVAPTGAESESSASSTVVLLFLRVLDGSASFESAMVGCGGESVRMKQRM